MINLIYHTTEKNAHQWARIERRPNSWIVCKAKRILTAMWHHRYGVAIANENNFITSQSGIGQCNRNRKQYLRLDVNLILLRRKTPSVKRNAAVLLFMFAFAILFPVFFVVSLPFFFCILRKIDWYSVILISFLDYLYLYHTQLYLHQGVKRMTCGSDPAREAILSDWKNACTITYIFIKCWGF